MLLPSEYASWSRTRFYGDIENLVTTIRRTTLSGSWPNTKTDYPYIRGGLHITVDHKNTGWAWSRKMLKKDPNNEELKSRDFGCPFISNHLRYTPPAIYRKAEKQKVDWGGPLLLHEHYGPVWPCYSMYQKFQNPINVRSMPVGMEWGDLWVLGGSFIAQTLPTVPEMNISVSAAEILREGLPKMIGSSLVKKSSVKSTADEYLNLIFGYGPILNDLESLATALPEMEERLKQLVRDSGRQVRRGIKPRTVMVDSSFDHRIAPYAGSNIPGGNTVGTCRHTVTKEVTTWFSAAYVYNLPSTIEISDRFAQIRYVLGLNVDALTIWNLIPWSWLVDWVLPVSPILQNLSVMARNQVRIQRAYIMCHTKSTETARNGPFQATLEMESRQRDRASPWGFGVKSTALTSTQLSILAALGLSRGHI